MNDFADQIERIMTRFDFRSVHQCMEKLNWCWAETRDEKLVRDVPSIKCLMARAKEMLIELTEREDVCCIETGGFSVRRFSDDTLLLQFVLEDMDGRSWEDIEIRSNQDS